MLQALRPVEIEFLERLLINKECSTSELESFSWNKDLGIIADHHLTLRRYSDPCFPDNDDTESKASVIESKDPLVKPLKRCFSSISFMHLTSDQDQDGKNLKQNGHDGKGSEDNVSVATTCTNSTVDSFEIALAIGAKHSDYVSPGNKELLHNLFVSVAGKLRVLFVGRKKVANRSFESFPERYKAFATDLNFKHYSFKLPNNRINLSLDFT